MPGAASADSVDLTVVEAVDTGELVSLYDSVGWTAYTVDPDGLARAIAGSTHVVTARHEGLLIGLARGLSDDASIFYLQDILVRPEWQRRGVGASLLNDCLRRYRHVRQKVLITDDGEGQHRFYRALGYRDIGDLEPAVLHAFVQIAGPGATPATAAG